jgi:hypothetical protein
LRVSNFILLPKSLYGFMSRSHPIIAVLAPMPVDLLPLHTRM